MLKLTKKERKTVSGGRYVPDSGSLLVTTTFGALGGAIAGAVGGPAMMAGGAVSGAAMAAAGHATHEAREMQKQNKAKDK